MNWWLVLGGVVAYEGLVAADRHARRTRSFDRATARASELGRPLVVVGDPDAGCHTKMAPAYGCGAVCVDLNGCPACPVSVAVDITKGLPFGDDSAVIFESCVLEYVGDARAGEAEMLRAAGAPSNVFSVDVDADSLTSFLYPGAKWRRTRRGVQRVTPLAKVVVAGGLLALTALAVWGRR